MKKFVCISCSATYKVEASPKALITSGICSKYCRESVSLWSSIPLPKRPQLRHFHHARTKAKAVA